MHLIHKLVLLLFIITTTGRNFSLPESVTTLSTIMDLSDRIVMTLICLIPVIWLLFYYGVRVIAPTTSVDRVTQPIPSNITSQGSAYDAGSLATICDIVPQVKASDTVFRSTSSINDLRLDQFRIILSFTAFNPSVASALTKAHPGKQGDAFRPVKDLIFVSRSLHHVVNSYLDDSVDSTGLSFRQLLRVYIPRARAILNAAIGQSTSAVHNDLFANKQYNECVANLSESQSKAISEFVNLVVVNRAITAGEVFKVLGTNFNIEESFRVMNLFRVYEINIIASNQYEAIQKMCRSLALLISLVLSSSEKLCFPNEFMHRIFFQISNLGQRIRMLSLASSHNQIEVSTFQSEKKCFEEMISVVEKGLKRSLRFVNPSHRQFAVFNRLNRKQCSLVKTLKIIKSIMNLVAAAVYYCDPLPCSKDDNGLLVFADEFLDDFYDWVDLFTRASLTNLAASNNCSISQLISDLEPSARLALRTWGLMQYSDLVFALSYVDSEQQWLTLFKCPVDRSPTSRLKLFLALPEPITCSIVCGLSDQSQQVKIVD